MKKLIAISVVFALVAGAAFAVDLAASVIGTVQVIKADSDSGRVGAGGGWNQLRLQGAAEVADGKFGGWFRLEPAGWGISDPYADPPLDADKATSYSFGTGIQGYAWWKPIDQLKLIIGQNTDGFFEYNGYSCWMFYQSATDTGVAMEGTPAWGGAYGLWPLRYRQAFAHGYDAGGLAIQITPVDIVEINIGLPFFGASNIEDVFKSTYAQIALNMSFGTFAVTYAGNSDITASEVYAYFALKAIDNLEIDFGLGTNFKASDDAGDRLNIGLAMKYGADSWGIKFRSLFGVPIKDGQGFGLLLEVLPYFVINESFRVYAAAGAGFKDATEIAAGAGWHVNPYIEVGEEWGPKFLAGIKVYQQGNLKTSAPVNFEVPIALIVSF